MPRKTLAALALFAAVTALPLLSPGESAASRGQSGGDDEIVSVCPLDGNVPQTIHLLTPGKRDQLFRLDFIDPAGNPVSSFQAILPGPNTGYVAAPDGLDGQARVRSSADVFVFYNSYGDGTPESPFAGGPCDRLVLDGVNRQAVYPFVDDRQAAQLFNTGPSPIQFQSCLKGTNGELTCGNQMVGGDQQEEFDPRDLDGKGFQVPITLHAFNNAASIQIGYDGLTQKEPADYLPATDSTELGNTSLIPLPPDPVITSTVQLQVTNPGTSPQEVEVKMMDEDGATMHEQMVNVLPETTRVVAITMTANLGQGSVQAFGTGDLDTTIWHDGSTPRTGRAAKGGSAVWRGSAPDMLIGKLGYAAGAPSAKQSRVSVVLMNPTTNKAKVKLRIYDADTGKKVQSGKANVPAGGTATVPFKKKARGVALYAEIRVKGKGAVYGWLLRDYKGDVDFYPAVPRS